MTIPRPHDQANCTHPDCQFEAEFGYNPADPLSPEDFLVETPPHYHRCFRCKRQGNASPCFDVATIEAQHSAMYEICANCEEALEEDAPIDIDHEPIAPGDHHYYG